MAKKIQIDIEVNGKMQKATVSAKKLNAALQDTSNSAQQTDRNIKGTAQASANASKNFSKMSQGMGGLVGAYAALAASLFAVSAAFNFLKRAGELKSLQAGQVAYASATGTSLSALTENIIQATNAQIAFRDAAQAAAIGTAAGLGADQLERLGKAAADASQVLGRDVTDSFNRLVRGVTKAEPELLDELGIILRLENATNIYASALNKNAKELTAFERSQAVANDVLAQAEDKYGRILDITGRSPNQYAQLGKAFDDLVMKVQKLVDVVAGPLAKVLQDTPALAIASFLLLLRGPLAALGINFQEMATNASTSAAKQVNALKAVKLEAARAAKSVKVLRKEFATQAASASALNPDSKVLDRAAKGTMKGADFANLDKALKSAEAQYAKHAKITSGIFKGMSIDMVRSVNGAFIEMQRAQDVTVSKTKVATTQMKLRYTQVATAIKTAGAAILTFGTKLLRFAGWVGIAVTIYQVLKDLFFGTEEAADKASTGLERQRKTIEKITGDLEHFAEIQGILAENSKNLSGFGNIGNALGNLTGSTLTTAIGDLKEYGRIQDQIAKEEAKRSGWTNDMKDVFGDFVGGKLGGLFGYANEVLFGTEQTEATENAKKTFNEIRNAIIAVENETGRTMVTFTKLKEMLANPDQYPTEDIEAYIKRAQDLGKQLSEYPRIAQTASQSLLNFTNSIGPITDAQQTMNDLQAQIDAIFSPAEQGETFLTQEEIDKMNELKDRVKLIADFRDRAHRAAMRQLATQLKLTNEVVGESQAAQAVREAQNAITQNADKQLDIQEKIKDIEETKKGLTGELTPEDLNRLQILRAQLDVEEKIAGILDAKLALEKELKPLRDSETAANVEQKRLQNLQQLVNLEQKKMGYVKEQAAALETVLNARFDRALMSARSAGGHMDPRKEQAARIKLEEHLVKIKTAQINREFKMKMTTLTMEERNLKVRNKLAKIQYEIAIKKNGELPDEATLAMFNAIDNSISETARLGRETAEITRNTALETVDLTLDKLKQAAADMSFKGQMAQTFEESFRDGLNSALSGLVSGDMSFKEAMMSFINTIADAAIKRLQDMLVDAIMEAIFGPEEDIAEKMERILKEEKMSSKVGEAIEEGGTSMAKKLDDVLSQEIQTRVKVECCKESDTAGDIATLATGVMAVGGLATGGGEYTMGKMGEVIPIMGSQTSEWFTNAAGMEEMVITASPGALTFSEKIAAAVDGVPLLGDLMYELTGGDSGGGLLQNLGKIFASPLGLLGSLFGGGKGFADGSSFASMSTPTGIPFGPASGGGGGGSIISSITSMFSKFLYGSAGKGGGEASKGLFGFFSSIFGFLTSPEMGMAIMKIIGPILAPILSLFGGGGFGGPGGPGAAAGLLDIVAPVAGMFGFARYGGIMSPPKGYRAGGIANGSAAGYPAVLHGREAVVPLPHGNKIPVELKGVGGQQNNIGVTVNIASDGSSSISQDNAQAEQEGKSMAAAISAAVTQELIKQRRAGGMLSPYGAA